MEFHFSSFMDWVYLSYATSSLLFVLIFTLLYYAHRNRYLKLWSASYAVMASAYLFLYLVLAFNYSVLIPLNLFAIVSGSYLFYRASLDYMHCQEKPIWKILMGLAIILTAGMVYSEYMLIYGWVVFSFFSGLFYLSSGILFVRSKDNINRLVGSMILLLSLMIFVSPLIANILWTIPWFYLINGMLGLIVTLGILGLHFRSLNQVLINREKELRTIADNMTDVVAMADVEGRFTYLSESNYHLSGYKPSELLGKNILDLIHEDDLSAVGAVFQEGVVEGRKDARVEYRVRHKKGGYVWVETIGSLMLDDNGQPSGALSVSRDISDRKKAEESLKESEEKFRFLVDYSYDLIWILKADGFFTYASPSCENMLGYKPSYIVGKAFQTFMRPEDVVPYEKYIVEILEAKKALPGPQYRVKHADGSWQLHEATMTPVYNDEGQFLYFVGVSRDISDRKQAQEQIERLAQIADRAPSSILVHDYEGNLFYANEQTFHLYGYIKEEFMKLNLRDISTPESAELIRARMKEIEEKGEAKFEVRHVRKDSSTFPLQVYVKQTEWFGKPALLSVSTDISEQKKAEEVLRGSEQEKALILNNANDSIAFHDKELRLHWANRAYLQGLRGITGLSATLDTVKGKKCYEAWGLTKHCNDCPVSLAMQTGQPQEKEMAPLNQEHWPATQGAWLVRAAPVRDSAGIIIGAIEIAHDITDRKKAEEKIIHISFHDQLTDLYNRHYFEACEEELKKIPLLSVIMTDVNGLKLINDTYGHGAGDEMLKKYADLLRESFKQSDLIFRWGGDEFIIILKNTEEAKSWELCNRLVKHCGETFVKDIPLSISVGISSKLQGGNIDEAMNEAEDMMYKNKLTESKSSKNLIMKTLQQTLSEKSFETKEHIDRMTSVGRQFGEKLSLSPSELSRLETLTMLHDIGKINIDSHILLKETALTDEEWEEIKKHPEVGYRITRTTEEFAYIAEEIFAHHERWDGKGYPQGLEGESIPYLSRLLNLIDSYDVMSNGRPYKKKMLTEEIIEEIERCSGKQFDPELAKEFVACLKEGAITYQ